MSESDSSRDSSALSADSDDSFHDTPLLKEGCLKIRPSDNFTPIASLTPFEKSDRFQMREVSRQKAFVFPESNKTKKTLTDRISDAFAVELDYAMRNNINKDDLLYAPYPIKAMTPISFLEQLAQIALRVEILLKAEKLGADEIHEQTALTTSFAIAFVGHLRNNADLHPFMPVLGETFEVSSNECRPWRFLAEQVEVDVTAVSLMSPGFHFQQNLHLKSEYNEAKKIFSVFPSGSGRLVFEKSANDVSWSFDSLRFTIAASSKSSRCAARVDGTFNVINANGDNAKVVFRESDPEATTPFSALIFNRTQSKLIGLNGDLQESINGVFPAPKLRKGSRSPLREPINVHLVTVKILNPEARLKYSSRELEALPPTDSRHRADVLYMRRAVRADNAQEASGLFAKAQHKHEKYLRREYSRRIASAPLSSGSDGCSYDNNNVLPAAELTPFEDPLWFERLIEGGHVHYRYIESEAAEYWTARAHGGFGRCADLFDLLSKKKC